jgi:hypothetical protein
MLNTVETRVAVADSRTNGYGAGLAIAHTCIYAVIVYSNILYGIMFPCIGLRKRLRFLPITFSSMNDRFMSLMPGSNDEHDVMRVPAGWRS